MSLGNACCQVLRPSHRRRKQPRRRIHVRHIGGARAVKSSEQVIGALKRAPCHGSTWRVPLASPPACRRCSLLPRTPLSAPGGLGARHGGLFQRAEAPPSARRGDKYATAALPNPRRGATRKQYKLIFSFHTVPSSKARTFKWVEETRTRAWAEQMASAESQQPSTSMRVATLRHK
jgi:hypothetical protein